ncbi:fibrinogen C domain-containing protein 1-B-like, partial [Sinocyclocheilus rhinocerous]|uniref:fibrinogen C domain-containing protein 1-B-like n=1 Tax=Sinocyclocheilus rhinocerous TaxID=307959 RepID=UPI0007B8D670
MVNDRWKIMNSVSELEDGQQHKSQRMSCSYLLCTILLFVAVLLAVTVTGIILLMNHYQAPSGPNGPPLISTNQDEGNALVTIERGDGSRINIFIDPNCPDYNNNFLRLEGVQTSLLHSLTDHDTDLKSVKGQDRALLVKLAEEVAKLSAHASQLKMEYNALRQGQGNIGQELSTLQTEQGRLIQLLSESQINMVKVVNSVSDALSSMQKETGNIKSRLKADLQRAPVHSVRPKGCTSGEGSRPRDCSDIYASGQREDGIYSVFPTHYPEGFQVFCDMITDGGGWTVIQRREDGSVNFFRDWEAYREGFGKITGEHWLAMMNYDRPVTECHLGEIDSFTTSAGQHLLAASLTPAVAENDFSHGLLLFLHTMMNYDRPVTECHLGEIDSFTTSAGQHLLAASLTPAVAENDFS